MPCHIGTVAGNIISFADDKVGHILCPFFLVPGNRTGISIGNLIAVPDDGLALAVFNGILRAADCNIHSL